MKKQRTLSVWSDELAQARTRKKEVLELIDRIVPWGEWVTIITPYSYKGERGNKPYELDLTLRLFIRQNLYDPADRATPYEAIDSRAFSPFCAVDSGNQAPDGDTIGRLRRMREEQGIPEKRFA